MAAPSHNLYSVVETGSEGEFDHFIEKPSLDTGRKSRVRQLVLVLPWVFTVVFASLSMFLLIDRSSVKDEVAAWGTYENGFDTDHGK